MPGKITFDIRGADQLEEALKTIGPRVARRVGARAMRAAAKPIVQEAKRRVPVKTGKLKRSITANPKRTRVEKELMIQVGFKPPASSYAHLVEYGSVKQAPQPFMRPALDAKAAEAIEEMGRVIWEGIESQVTKD